MEERRKSDRIDTQLHAQWHTTSGVHEGTIVNCSVGGCFVQAQVDEPGNEPMKLEVHLPNGRSIHLWGEVSYYLPTMGFGLHFAPSSAEAQGVLIEYLRLHQGVASTV